MKTGAYTINLDFDQILDLVKRLSKKVKPKPSKELERDIMGAKLTSLLKAFRTNELTQDAIDKEVEIVRTELYSNSKSK
jgi:hypothetical protein